MVAWLSRHCAWLNRFATGSDGLTQCERQGRCITGERVSLRGGAAPPRHVGQHRCKDRVELEMARTVQSKRGASQRIQNVVTMKALPRDVRHRQVVDVSSKAWVYGWLKGLQFQQRVQPKTCRERFNDIFSKNVAKEESLKAAKQTAGDEARAQSGMASAVSQWQSRAQRSHEVHRRVGQ